MTSGSATGAYAWVAKNNGGTNARTSPFISPWDPTTEFPFFFSEESISTSNQFVIENLTEIADFTVNLVHSTALVNATGARLMFSDLKITSEDWSSRTSYTIIFNGCDLGRLYATGDLWAISCQFDYTSISNGASVVASGGLFTNGSIVWPVGYFYIESYSLYQSPDTNNCKIYGGSLECYGIQVFDSTTAGITVNNGGKAYFGGVAFGSGNISVGIEVGAGSSVIYDSKPTIVGNNGNSSIGGTTTAWGDVPSINTDNNAMIVENA